jgi:hypothetical protein
MKKVLLLLTVLVLVVSCATEKKPVEVQIPKQNVELTGNGFQIFRLGADLKLVTVQNPDKADEWMIRGSVPLMKVSEDLLAETAIDVNLLDENGMKLRDGFVLTAEDLVNLIPKYNAENNVEKNIVFSAAEGSRKYFTYKEAADLLNAVKSVAMNVNVVQQQPEVSVEQVAAEKKAEQKEPVTFKSLMSKYGIYGKLTQYDNALKNKDKKKAKKIEDELFTICKKVKADPSVPESVYKQFRQYIEDEEDRIEDKY